MTTRNQTTGKPIRISVADLQTRLQAGEAASIFDVRNQFEWNHSDRKIPGALRPEGGEIGLDPAWSEDRLLVAY